jgi:hypothetical protein
MLFLLPLVVIASTIWVAVDVSQRDWDAGYARPYMGWVVSCLLLWIVYFPLYLARRGQVPIKG